MEEAFRREKQETDRLFYEQKIQYESQIVQLQKQVMETSMSHSMISSILSSPGLIDSQSTPNPIVEEENFIRSLSENEQRLAWRTWKKWCQHQMTSLRVSSILLLTKPNLERETQWFQHDPLISFFYVFSLSLKLVFVSNENC